MRQSRTVFVATVVLLLGLGYVFGRRTKIIIPDDFNQDAIVVLFNFKSGEKAEWTLTGYEVRIPSSGVLRVKDDPINLDGAVILTQSGQKIREGQRIAGRPIHAGCDSLEREIIFIPWRTDIPTDSLMLTIVPKLDFCAN